MHFLCKMFIFMSQYRNWAICVFFSFFKLVVRRNSGSIFLYISSIIYCYWVKLDCSIHWCRRKHLSAVCSRMPGASLYFLALYDFLVVFFHENYYWAVKGVLVLINDIILSLDYVNGIIKHISPSIILRSQLAQCLCPSWQFFYWY